MGFGSNMAQYSQSVTGTAGGIGATNIPAGARYAEGYVRTASVVVSRISGFTPTATVGQQWDPGDLIILRSRDEINAFQAIRQSATSATIDWFFWPESPLANVEMN